MLAHSALLAWPHFGLHERRCHGAGFDDVVEDLR